MTELPERPHVGASARPFWQWILLAVAPGLVCDVLASILAALGKSSAANEFAGLVMACLLGMPLLMIPYLIVLSKHYTKARAPAQAGSRSKFVLGFCAVNLFLWGGSCVLTLSNMDFH